MPLIRKTPDQTAPAAEAEVTDPLAALRRGTSDERWAAARAAVDVPDAVAALSGALADEADPRVREAILTALARIGTHEAARAVLPHLRSDDAGVRIGALDALRAMPETAGALLPELFADADPDVRLLACDLARGLPSAEATRLLCELIDHEHEANVCAAAVEVLAETGGPEALPALRRCGARFQGDPFLEFAIKLAADGIDAQPAPRD